MKEFPAGLLKKHLHLVAGHKLRDNPRSECGMPDLFALRERIRAVYCFEKIHKPFFPAPAPFDSMGMEPDS